VTHPPAAPAAEPRADPPRRGHWGRRLARCAFGVGLAVLTGWLIVVGALALWGVYDLLTGGDGDPFKVAAVFGLMGAIIAAPIALVVGIPVWLIADRRGLTRASSGAIAGAVIGVIVCGAVPFLIMVLPFVGAVAGYFAVRTTNRVLPKTWR